MALPAGAISDYAGSRRYTQELDFFQPLREANCCINHVIFKLSQGKVADERLNGRHPEAVTSRGC